MNPVLIDLGFIQIRWYAVIILIAFIIGYILVKSKLKKIGISSIHISDMCFYLVIFCLIGARLYYCLFEWKYYLNYPLDILKVWEGGLAIHGGIIAGFLFLCFYVRKKDISILDILDIFAPALVLGQAIGRWGNFFNQEAYGPITTLENLQNLNIPNFIIDGMYINGNYYHPTFFYESIACLIIFIILIIIRNLKFIKRGHIVSIYLIGYGITRFFIESLRQDSLMFFNLKIAQIVSIIMIIIGLILFIRPYYIEKRLKKYS